MKSIPIYDATAPIACTATGADRSGRIEQIERLRATLTSIEPAEHGMLLRFPNEPAIEEELRRFAVEEKQCCRFWGFDVAVRDAELLLRWDAPPTAGALVERLLAYFDGDEPISAISDLL